MIHEPIRDLSELAKDAERDYSHQDLMADIYLYLGGSVEGFPLDHAYRLRAGKATTVTAMGFLRDLPSCKNAKLYSELIARIKSGKAKLPENVEVAARKFLYEQKEFPRLSASERKEGLVRELEKSFVLDPKMELYWDQVSKYGEYFLSDGPGCKFRCLSYHGELIFGEPLHSKEKELVQRDRVEFSSFDKLWGKDFKDNYYYHVPWRFGWAFDFDEVVEGVNKEFSLAMMKMYLILHFTGRNDMRPAFSDPSDLFRRQVDLNLYSWLQTYGLTKKVLS